MTPGEALAFVAQNHRAILVTKKKDGALQTSPVTVGVDSDNKVIVSSRETAYKVRNLRRDPYATVCVFTDGFFGDWIQIDGPVELVPLPEAMDGLIEYYRSISGEHPDWDDYKQAMVDDRRLLVRIDVERAGPSKSG